MTPALAGRVGRGRRRRRGASSSRTRASGPRRAPSSAAATPSSTTPPRRSTPAAARARRAPPTALTDTVKVYGEGRDERGPQPGRRRAQGRPAPACAGSATERLTLDVGVRAARETDRHARATASRACRSARRSASPAASPPALGRRRARLRQPARSTRRPGCRSSRSSSGLARGGLEPAAGNAARQRHRPPRRRLPPHRPRDASAARPSTRSSGDARRRCAPSAPTAQVFERTKLYGRYERQEGWSYLQGVTSSRRRADAFVFGVDSTYIKDTQLFSEYRLRDAVSGPRPAACLGHAQLLERARGHARHHRASSASRSSAARRLRRRRSASASTTPPTRCGARAPGSSTAARATSRPRRRRRGLQHHAVAAACVARKLSRDWTLLGRNYLLQDRLRRPRRHRAEPRPARRRLPRHRHQPRQRARQGRVEARARRQQRGGRRAEVARAHRLDARRLAPVAAVVADRPRSPASGSATASSTASATASTPRSPPAALVYDLTENWDVGLLAAAQPARGPERRAAVRRRRRGGLPAAAEPVAVGRLQRQRLQRRRRPRRLRVHCSAAPTCACASSSTRPCSSGSDREVNRTLERTP